MEQQVQNLLVNQFRGMEVELQTLPSGRVAGHVVWQGFEDFHQTDRRQRLRCALQQHFGAEAQGLVVLLTYTPTEMEEITSDWPGPIPQMSVACLEKSRPSACRKV